MKGVSAVLTVIMIFVITIALVSVIYTWTTSTTGGLTATGKKQVQQVTKQLSTCMRIDSVSGNRIYLRNCGFGVITNDSISVFVDGAPVSFSLKQDIQSSKSGELEILDLWRFSPGTHTVKVSSGTVTAQKSVRLKPDESAIAFWSFDEGSGLVTEDSVNRIDLLLKDRKCVYRTGTYGTHWYEYIDMGCMDTLKLYPRWKEAKSFCDSRGGYIPVVSSSNENSFLLNLAGRGWKWIGYYQDRDDLSNNNGWPDGCPNEPAGCWKWLPNEASSYTNWNTGEPNNGGGTEHCAVLSYRGTWYDVRCWNWYNFICEHATQAQPLTIDGDVDYPDWTEGYSGTAISFDGYDDWLQVDNFSEYDPQKEISVFLRINKTWDFGKWVINRRSTNSTWAGWRSWAIAVTKSRGEDVIRACLSTVTNGIRCIDANATGLYDGKWHLIGMSYNGTHISVYYDGRELESIEQSGEIYYDYKNPQASSKDWRLFVGDFDGGPSSGTAVIDDVMIFDRALTPQEAFGLSER